MNEELNKENSIEYAFGCLPSPVDVRDYKLKMPAMAAEYPEEFELEMGAIKNQGCTGSCHDSLTQVLTKYGWKLFKDITKEDELASVNPATNTIIFEHPSDIIAFEYAGNMVVGKHLSLDFKVTPDHNMLVRPWDSKTNALSDTYQFVKADELGCYCGLMSSFNYDGTDYIDDTACIVFPEERLANGNILHELKINLHDWVQLLGIYLAEGTLCTDPIYYHYRIQLAAVKPREVNYIHDLLKRIGIVACEHKKDRFVFHNKRIWNKFAEYGLHGVKAKDKFIPDFIFDLPSRYLQDFLFGFAMGDGMPKHTGGVYHYFTSSPKLAEQLQIISLLAGHLSKITVKAPKEVKIRNHVVPADHISPAYTISERIKPLSIEKKTHISTEYYEGMVYCATMPTYHTLITKRNENILVSGNCVAHSLSEVCEYFNKQQEKTDKVMSTGYIYGNRRNSLSKTAGMYTREALSNMCKFGDVYYEDFPENVEVPKAINIFEERADSLKDKAYPNRFSTYFRVYSDDEIKHALMNYGPVIITITWYDDIKVDKTTGVVTTTQDKENQSGGHCMVIYGWNKNGWKIMNSWGIAWGKAGTCIYPFDLKKNETWGVTDEVTGENPDIVMPFNDTTLLRIIAKIFNWFGNLFKKHRV